jgi:hypothetical protein
MHITGTQADQLGDPQPRLHGDEQHRAVTPSDPRHAIGHRQERIDLRLSQEVDQCSLEALGLDRENAGDVRRMLRVTQGGVAEQRVDGREPSVARAHGISSLVLEVIQERANERSVDIGEVQGGGRLAGALAGKAEQHSPSVPIGSNSQRARVALAQEPLGEERLQRRCERAHGLALPHRSRRSAAVPSNSGDADRYQ